MISEIVTCEKQNIAIITDTSGEFKDEDCTGVVGSGIEVSAAGCLCPVLLTLSGVVATRLLLLVGTFK